MINLLLNACCCMENAPKPVVFQPFTNEVNIIMAVAFIVIIFTWFFLWHKYKITLNKLMLALSSGIVLICGIAVYWIGFSEHKGLGSTGSWLGNLFLSMLSSFKMFAFDSDLELIEEERENPLYMACFGITHAAAASISIIFIINYFGVRLASFINRMCLHFYRKIEKVYIFFGVDEHSMSIAEDIRSKNKRLTKHVIIFVDTAIEEEQESGISSLIGKIRYRRELFTKVNNIDALLLHNRYINIQSGITKKLLKKSSKERPKFDIPYLKISHLLNKSGEVVFFAMSEDEIININTLCGILSTSEVKDKCKFYCHAFRENSNMEFEKYSDNNGNFDVRIIDSSYLSAMDLKTMTDEESEINKTHLNCPIYKCNPISFLEAADGLATTEFNAAVIGFGNVGVAVLNFIYEYGQFPYKDMSRPHFSCHVFDKNMDMIKGHFFVNEPGLRPNASNEHLIYDTNSMIYYHNMDTASDEFWLKIERMIVNLNYVVICLGNDEQGIDLAADIYELAVKKRSDEKGRLKDFKIFVKSYEEDNENRMQKTFSTCDNTIIPFGQPSKLFKYKLINDSETKDHADKFNKSYNTLYELMNNSDMSTSEKIKSVFSLDSDKDKNILSKINRIKNLRSEAQNISNAYHTYTKLRLLGLFENDKLAYNLINDIDKRIKQSGSDVGFDLSKYVQNEIIDNIQNINIVNV